MAIRGYSEIVKRVPMPKFNGSTIVEASREELWGMLPELPEIGSEFMGVQKIELMPAGRPFEAGARLHITMNALGRVIVAHIVDIDDQAFAFQSRFAGAGISGEAVTQAHHINAGQSRLEVAGDVHGNLLTAGLVALGVSVFKREGVRQIGQTLSRHALARRVP